MIGRILLILLGAFLLAIAVLLLIPLNIRIGYESGSFHVSLSYAVKKFVLFPRPEKEPDNKQENKSDTGQQKPATEKTKKKLNWDDRIRPVYGIGYRLEG